MCCTQTNNIIDWNLAIKKNSWKPNETHFSKEEREKPKRSQCVNETRVSECEKQQVTMNNCKWIGGVGNMYRFFPRPEKMFSVLVPVNVCQINNQALIMMIFGYAFNAC